MRELDYPRAYTTAPRHLRTIAKPPAPVMVPPARVGRLQSGHRALRRNQPKASAQRTTAFTAKQLSSIRQIKCIHRPHSSDAHEIRQDAPISSRRRASSQRAALASRHERPSNTSGHCSDNSFRAGQTMPGRQALVGIRACPATEDGPAIPFRERTGGGATIPSTVIYSPVLPAFTPARSIEAQLCSFAGTWKGMAGDVKSLRSKMPSQHFMFAAFFQVRQWFVGRGRRR